MRSMGWTREEGAGRREESQEDRGKMREETGEMEEEEAGEGRTGKGGTYGGEPFVWMKGLLHSVGFKTRAV